MPENMEWCDATGEWIKEKYLPYIVKMFREYEKKCIEQNEQEDIELLFRHLKLDDIKYMVSIVESYLNGETSLKSIFGTTSKRGKKSSQKTIDRDDNIRSFIVRNLQLNISQEAIIAEIHEKFQVSEQRASRILSEVVKDLNQFEVLK